MALKRVCAFFVSAFILLSAAAYSTPCSTVTQNVPSDNSSLPLSLASPAGNKMYFLPSRNEVLSADPVKKGFILPKVTSGSITQAVSLFTVDSSASGFPGETCFTESITPRAP